MRPKAAPANRSFRGLLYSLRVDLTGALVHLLRNVVAGSFIVPRAVRFVLYRILGLRVETPDIASGQRIDSRNLLVGRQSVIGPRCFFEGQGRISIGSHCLIGAEVAFVTSAHAGDGAGGIERQQHYRAVVVEDHAWVGTRCILLPGSVVGRRCVIAAGSVVSGTCEPGFVYSGMPARKVGRTAALPTGVD
ncbi:MAG TPA: acyltransferase [Acidimicrobiales bacterium]|nr:acyltransferase [Acidimicrobiales bacterium]